MYDSADPYMVREFAVDESAVLKVFTVAGNIEVVKSTTGGILFSVMVNLDLISGDPMMGNILCSSGLIFAMSIYLSRDIAKTQKRLEHKLIEVKHLSERSLEQERINKKKELERKLLAVENERKSRELEEARALQLSMLPKQISQTDEWDIAVFMETAQEVGGDDMNWEESAV